MHKLGSILAKRSGGRLPAAAAALCLLCLVSSCRLFEYSPYALPEGEGKDARTMANLRRIAPPNRTGGFSFAVIADTHTAYDQLLEAVRHINADTSIRFTIAAGDLTQYGLFQEYRWFKDLMSLLSQPYLTVLGNHDALANGAGIYRKLFGPLDYTFRYGGVKFICLNDNAWEFPRAVPDFAWLEEQLSGTDGSERVVVVSHIPPFGDQFNPWSQKTFAGMLARHRVALSIHGHQHNYHFGAYYGDGVTYLVADDIEDRNYVKVTFTAAGFTSERIFYR
jgi:3',5'-cyclic-AMP phosphodiesterase